MKKLFSLLTLALLSLTLWAQSPITLSSNRITYRTHDSQLNKWHVEFTATDGSQVTLEYVSMTEEGTFTTDELDLNESAIINPDGDWFFFNAGSFTVATPNGEYNLTGNLTTERSDDPTILQDYILDVHRPAPLQAKDTVSLSFPTATFSHTFNAARYSDVARFQAQDANRQLSIVYNAWAAYNTPLEQALMDLSQTAIRTATSRDTLVRFERGEVVVNDNLTYTLTAGMLLSDTVFYNVTMVAPLPAVQAYDTITLTNLSHELNPMSGDFVLMADNNDFAVTLFQKDGVEQDGHIQGQGLSAELTDMVSYNTYLAYYVSADVAVFANPDSQLVVADIYASNDVLYHVNMQYIVPAATDTIALSVLNARYVNNPNSGQYGLMGEVDDYEVSITLQLSFELEQGEEMPEDNMASYLFSEGSYVQHNGQTIHFLKGTIEASRSLTDTVTYIAHVLGDDAVFYHLTLQGAWEPMHLDEDTQNADVTYAFNANAIVTKELSAYPSYIEVNDAEGTRSLAIEMLIESSQLGEDDRIPAGTYTIASSWEYGTAIASEGKYFDIVTMSYSVYPSLYVEQDATNAFVYHYYFLRSGTVTVSYADGVTSVVVDAYNSYNRHVQVSFTDAASTSLSAPAAAEPIVEKRLVNGRLLLRQADRLFDVLGQRVE